jgi:2-(1,2-epoxy-1,2-dihydrophenyl)acetyl-CoA isomerase
MKANLDQAVLGNLEQCMDDEVARHLACALSADHAEAARAFVDKREPRFTGR